MKQVHLAYILFVSMLFIIACEKEETENPIIVEPQQWREVAKDSISTGMEVSRVYPQLLALSSISQYAPKFQRISLFSKNTNKDFDSAMAQSPQWYFAHGEAEGKQKRIHLYFKEGKLQSVVNGLYAPF